MKDLPAQPLPASSAPCRPTKPCCSTSQPLPPSSSSLLLSAARCRCCRLLPPPIAAAATDAATPGMACRGADGTSGWSALPPSPAAAALPLSCARKDAFPSFTAFAREPLASSASRSWRWALEMALNRRTTPLVARRCSPFSRASAAGSWPRFVGTCAGRRQHTRQDGVRPALGALRCNHSAQQPARHAATVVSWAPPRTT